MRRKTRWSIVLGLALALGATGVLASAGGAAGTSGATASGSSVGVAQNGKPNTVVDADGRVRPNRQFRRQFRNVNLSASVAHDNADGSEGVPKYTKALSIDFGKNVRFRPNRPPKCREDLGGTTTDQVRELCPGRSIIGAGNAHVRLPGPTNIEDAFTLAIAGPGKNQIRFHAYSDTLGPISTQVIQGRIARNAKGKAYAWRLNVPVVPLIAGGQGANTLFGVTIRRNTGVVQARCQTRRFLWRAQWTFEDNTTQRDIARQPCRRR